MLSRQILYGVIITVKKTSRWKKVSYSITPAWCVVEVVARILLEKRAIRKSHFFSGTYDLLQGFLRQQLPTCPRFVATFLCRKLALREFLLKTQSSVPQQWRRQDKLPGSSRSKCI